MSVRKRIAAALFAATIAGAVLGVPAHAAESRGVTIPAFYTPPADLPAENGALIRTKPLPLALSLPGVDSNQ